MNIEKNIALASYTTFQLGGTAGYFCECTSVEDIKEAVAFANAKKVTIHILAGGSNTIFLDEGFPGLVLKIGIKGVSFRDDGSDSIADVKAGEEWDPFVHRCVESGYGGIECLSGIPGSVGATPIQNVGAYGQEVKDTIDEVTAIDVATMKIRTFHRSECFFSYRSSRFKTYDAGKYIITQVSFRLKKQGRPTTGYPEVKKTIEKNVDIASLSDGRESLTAVREIILSLRRKKSMVIDPADPNTRSAGSFFTNPIVDNDQFAKISEIWSSIGDGTPVPSFSSEGNTKIPAAWLIEKSGFHKGYTSGGVGISENHTLALVNKGGTTKELLALAEEIQSKVHSTFEVHLQREPVVIGER